MSVQWYGDQVRLELRDATSEGLYQLAQHIAGLAKQNIVSNGQVDTGFLLNSVYAAGKDASTYNETDSSGAYFGNDGPAQHKERAAEVDLPDTGGQPVAIVAVAAEYALYQEAAQPFLYPAVERGATSAGAIIKGAVDG